ncbi:MAG TPA: serine hydrolase, partial [Agriterribacter sp.]|nr:serine hydrolase [Agriterribacter sp.]
DAFPSGTGISSIASPISYVTGTDTNAAKFKIIDSLATEAIQQHAAPGMAIMAVKDGKIVFHKAYGYYTYDS